MDIQALIEKGQQQLTEQAAREAAEIAEAEQRRKEQEEALETEFGKCVLAALPEVLHPHITRKSKIDQWSKRGSAWLEIAECTNVRIDFVWELDKETSETRWQWDGQYMVATDPYIREDRYVENVGIGFHQRTAFETADLHLALATAAQEYEKQVVLEQELKARAEAREISLKEWDARRAEREAEMQVRRESQEAERARRLAMLERDKVAMGLLRLFAVIQEEREEWNDQIMAADERLVGSQERYEKRLEEADRTAREMGRERDEYRDRAIEAEDKVGKLERRARGNW